MMVRVNVPPVSVADFDLERQSFLRVARSLLENQTLAPADRAAEIQGAINALRQLTHLAGC